MTLLANLAEDPNTQKKMLKRVRVRRQRRRAVAAGPRPHWRGSARQSGRSQLQRTPSLSQELPALLVALLGFPCVELATAVLDLLRRMAIYSVRLQRPGLMQELAVSRALSASLAPAAPRRRAGACALPAGAPRLSRARHTPQEARTRIAAAGALGRALGYLTPSAPLRLQSCALRLLTNLALERKLRAAAVRGGLVQRLAHVLAAHSSGTSSSVDSCGDGNGGGGSRGAVPAQLQSLVHGCLYLASMEPAGRRVLASSELVPRCAAGARVFGLATGVAPRKPRVLCVPTAMRSLCCRSGWLQPHTSQPWALAAGWLRPSCRSATCALPQS